MNFGQDFLDANMMHIFCWIVIDDVCLFFKCVMFLQLHENLVSLRFNHLQCKSKF